MITLKERLQSEIERHRGNLASIESDYNRAFIKGKMEAMQDAIELLGDAHLKEAIFNWDHPVITPPGHSFIGQSRRLELAIMIREKIFGVTEPY